MAKRLGKLEMTQRAKKKGKPAKKVAPKKRAIRKPRQASGIDTVFNIIKRSRKGVGTDTLRRKTGFDRIKIFNSINALKRKGMIRNAGRGLYVKT